MTDKKLSEWLVIINDKPKSATKRPDLGPQHIRNMEPKRGIFWLLGGSMFDSAAFDQGSKEVTGNVIIALATSKEEVMEELGKDVYVSEGVWDIDNVSIMPFMSVFRKGLACKD